MGFVLRGLFEPVSDAESRPPAIRARIVLPNDLDLVVARGIDQRVGRYPPIAISPDGRHIAVVAKDASGVTRIYIRPLDELELKPLPGTEYGELPFFSPDGQWVGFLVGARVFKSPVGGGVPTAIGVAPLGTARGAAWVTDEMIVLGGVNTALSRMNAATGDVALLTSVEGTPYVQHSWPHALGDGEHVLFNSWSNEGTILALASLSTGDWHLIEQTDGGAQATYLDSGRLIFYRDGEIFAASFSLENLAIEGPLINVPLQDFVTGRASGVGLGSVAVSANGTLIFVPGTVDLDAFELVRVDRSGTAEQLSEGRNYVYMPAVSPDGTRLAVRSGGSLFLHELSRGSRVLLDDDGIKPVWSADGRQVYFDWFPGGDADMFIAEADGSRESETLLSRPHDQYVSDASDDGRFVVFEEIHPDTGWDLHLLPLDGSDPYPVVATQANERDGVFSPDGRFLSYTSDETGRDEIYVRELSGEGGRVPVSLKGGICPRWSPSGRELFYREGTKMMAVAVELEPTFRPGIPEMLFDGDYAESFDVFPNGDFSMITLADVDLRELEVVVNWHEELKQLVPTRQ